MSDIITYAGEINYAGYELLCEQLKQKSSEKVLLVLATPGGDPHAGYRMARALQHVYGSFDLLVPRYCKSAGTLIAVGAKALYMDDMSELGPLDIQVKKGDEIYGANSGLDILKGVNYLQTQAMSAFGSFLVELTRDLGLSTKIASEISSKLTTGIFEPISAQIDPMKLAEMQRAMEIAYEYGSRLQEHSKNLRTGGLQRLVASYPSHGFVIDRKEARNIFIKVVKPEGLLSEWSQAFKVAMSSTAHASTPVIQIFPTDIGPQESTDEAAPNAPTLAAGDPAGDKQVGGGGAHGPTAPSDPGEPPAADADETGGRPEVC